MSEKAVSIWEYARDVVLIAFVAFHFHDFALRVFGYLYLPSILGVEIPPILFTGSCITVLTMLAAWRMLFDSGWRARLANKDIRWFLASILICCAVLLLTAPTLTGILKIRNILYPLILFSLGYVCGINIRRIVISIAVIAALNIAMVIVTWIFFIETYITLILLYDNAIPGVKSVFKGTYRQSAAMMPTGLLVHRVYFRTFFVLAWTLFLHRALGGETSARARIWFGTFAALSFLMVVGSFSRTAMLTALFVCGVLLFRWYKEGGALKVTAAVRYAMLSVIFTLMVALGTFIFLMQQNVNLNLLDVETLFETSTYGRFGNWMRVIDTVDERRGWLIGADIAEPDVSTSRGEAPWSEHMFVASDNLFLDLLFRGGLILLFGYLMFLYFAFKNLREAKLEPDLTLFVATLLIFGNLETGNTLIAVVMLIAGARLGDHFWKKTAEKRVERAAQA